MLHTASVGGRAGLELMQSSLVNWAYNDTTFKLTPVVATGWPAGFELELTTTANARFNTTAAPTGVTLHSTHSSAGDATWTIDEPGYFFLATRSSTNVLWALAAVKYVPHVDDPHPANPIVALFSATSASAPTESGYIGTGVDGVAMSVARLWAPNTLGAAPSWAGTQAASPDGGPVMLPLHVFSNAAVQYRGVAVSGVRVLAQGSFSPTRSGELFLGPSASTWIRLECQVSGMSRGFYPFALGVEYNGLGYGF